MNRRINPPQVKSNYIIERVRTKKIWYDTGRDCVVCGKPIYRKVIKEITAGALKPTLLSCICIWDERFTCSANCRDYRLCSIEKGGLWEINGQDVHASNFPEALDSLPWF